MFEVKMASSFITVLIILFHTLNYPILSEAIRANDNVYSFRKSSVRLKQLGFVSPHVTKGSSSTLSPKFISRWSSRISEKPTTCFPAPSTTLKISQTSEWISIKNEDKNKGMKQQGLRTLRTQASSIKNSKFARILIATTLLASTLLRGDGPNLFLRYKQTLSSHPLGTKMITGGILAIIGDAIAQFQTNDDGKQQQQQPRGIVSYDTRRSISFVAFDMCYRALQQVTFPSIARLCGGEFLLRAVRSIPFLAKALATTSTSSSVAATNNLRHLLSALEQTCAFQFVVVPFLYYPVFFALTGVVQGLTPSEALSRAKRSFLPLMKRNLIFWIPVQFVTFAFVEGDLQIPLLCASGLVWTIILSGMAGSANAKTKTKTTAMMKKKKKKRTCDYVSSKEIDAARDTGLKRVTASLLEDAIKEEAIVDVAAR